MGQDKLKTKDWQIQLQALETPIGLTVSELKLQGKQAEFDLKHLDFQMPSGAIFDAKITLQDLTEFLKTRDIKYVEEMELALVPGKILADVVVRLGVKLTVKIVGNLKIHERNSLHLEIVDAQMLGMAPKGALQKIISEVNPLFEATMLPFPARFDEVEIMQGAIVLRGSASLPTRG